MAYKHPIATVIASERRGDVVVTVLKFDQSPSSPGAPASLWIEQRPDEPVVTIELHRVTQRGRKKLTFETYDSAAQPLAAGSTYSFVHWWGDSQLDIAHSDPAKWEQQRFEPQDAVKIRTSDGLVMARKLEPAKDLPQAEVVRGGWDHEHCFLCWESISQHQDNAQVGYTDGKDWLCTACYERFIASGFGRQLGEVT